MYHQSWSFNSEFSEDAGSGKLTSPPVAWGGSGSEMSLSAHDLTEAWSSVMISTISWPVEDDIVECYVTHPLVLGTQMIAQPKRPCPQRGH
jgi:hypothetical protein